MFKTSLERCDVEGTDLISVPGNKIIIKMTGNCDCSQKKEECSQNLMNLGGSIIHHHNLYI